MTETVAKIKEIGLKQGTPSEEEFKQIPDLLRRLRHLLRVYYDAAVTNKRSSEFKLCDIEEISDIGLAIHEVGIFLQLSPSRLKALVTAAPDLETFIVDEPLDVGKWRLRAETKKQAVEADIESTDDDCESYMETEDKAGKDCAAFQMAFLYGDLLVAFIMHPDLGARAPDRAMQKLVEISTSAFWRFALGDPLTDAMRPVYWTPKLLLKFAHAGGLPALIGDWAESTAKDGLCQQTVDAMPNTVWDHQTEESLLGVMRELIKKSQQDGEDFVTTPVFANMMHQIYSRYGLAPYERASTLSSDQIIFYYIYKRLSKHPEKITSAKAWMRFLEKYRKVPRATERRHAWSILTLSGRWDCLEFYGCAYEGCPERAALEEMSAQRVRGERSPEIEDRLWKFGAASKACVQCKHVSYCGKECQIAHWPSHKATCKKEAAKGKNEEI
ncbi:hypothetical protein FIBSPDRAFT_737762 [Athelia psychrophila]|uniref:MYND-type domain-containing protein n=1 Tax=Athelia psychrophila TaxID=1759441 RepID=A0A166LNG4_9AGAM|nr:hypothetical protein FIBSPDRAFT_737762 [Fibularhizoctonia sp. CBS 109695]